MKHLRGLFSSRLPSGEQQQQLHYFYTNSIQVMIDTENSHFTCKQNTFTWKAVREKKVK